MRQPPWVIVLAGGSSRRFGSDKLAARVAGRSVLDHCLLGMPPAWPIVVVGPVREVTVGERVAAWVRESPPGGGPLAAIAAGLEAVVGGGDGDGRGGEDDGIVAVAPGDTPGAGGVLVELVTHLRDKPHCAAVMAKDVAGQANPVLAAYRIKGLLEAMPSEPAGLPARHLLTMRHVLVRPAADARDIDTPEDLTAYGGTHEGNHDSKPRRP